MKNVLVQKLTEAQKLVEECRRSLADLGEAELEAILPLTAKLGTDFYDLNMQVFARMSASFFR